MENPKGQSQGLYMSLRFEIQKQLEGHEQLTSLACEIHYDSKYDKVKIHKNEGFEIHKQAKHDSDKPCIMIFLSRISEKTCTGYSSKYSN